MIVPATGNLDATTPMTNPTGGKSKFALPPAPACQKPARRLYLCQMRASGNVLTGLLASLILAASGTGHAEKERSPKKPAPADAGGPIPVLVELRDGSRLFGQVSLRSLKLRAAFGPVEVPLTLVRNIEFSDDRETARIECANGDRLSGALYLDSIALTGALGRVTIPLIEIVRLSIRASPRATGMVLGYSFDAVEDGSVENLAGPGPRGSVHGATWTSHGKQGGALRFGGGGDRVEVADDAGHGPLLDGQHPLTVALWIRRDQHPSGALFVKGRDPHFCLAHFDGLDPTRLVFAFKRGSDPDSIRVYAGGFRELNRWQHVAITYDGSGRAGGVAIYRDGEPQTVRVLNDGLPGAIRAPETFTIGAYRGPGGLDWFFRGTMDEFHVFDRRLSAAEIESLLEPRR
jgi:hypothetical protein